MKTHVAQSLQKDQSLKGCRTGNYLFCYMETPRTHCLQSMGLVRFLIFDYFLPPVITQQLAADVSVNLSELATAIRLSRFAVSPWKKRRYRFEFGHQTTIDHC